MVLTVFPGYYPSKFFIVLQQMHSLLQQNAKCIVSTETSTYFMPFMKCSIALEMFYQTFARTTLRCNFHSWLLCANHKNNFWKKQHTSYQFFVYSFLNLKNVFNIYHQSLRSYQPMMFRTANYTTSIPLENGIHPCEQKLSNDSLNEGSDMSNHNNVIDFFHDITLQRHLKSNTSQSKLVSKLHKLQTELINKYRNGYFDQRVISGYNELKSQVANTNGRVSHNNDNNSLWNSFRGSVLKSIFNNNFGSDKDNKYENDRRSSTGGGDIALNFKLNKAPIESLYIWGGVGQGKTMLMDAFYTSTHIKKKCRAHFHNFMLNIQQELHKLHIKDQPVITANKILSEKCLVKDTSQWDAVLQIAYELALQFHLICLDEFQVVHIADAMILKRLFEGLHHFGCIVVVTSNRPPNDLYKGGLNRDRFLPFIDLLNTHWDIFCLDAACDFRQYKSALSQKIETPVLAFNFPPRTVDDVLSQMQYLANTKNISPQPSELAISSKRSLKIPYELDNIAFFTFKDLCGTSVGTSDYIAVGNSFHTIFLHDIWSLENFNNYPNEIRRFIQLIDILYERLVLVIFDSQVPLLRLFGPSFTTSIFQELRHHIIKKYPHSNQLFIQALQQHIKNSPKQSLPAILGIITDAPQRITSLVVQIIQNALDKGLQQNRTEAISCEPREMRNAFIDCLMSALKFHTENYDITPDPYFTNIELSDNAKNLSFDFCSHDTQLLIGGSDAVESTGSMDNKFAFQRTVSRIRDMLTPDYLEQHKKLWDMQIDV